MTLVILVYGTENIAEGIVSLIFSTVLKYASAIIISDSEFIIDEQEFKF